MCWRKCRTVLVEGLLTRRSSSAEVADVVAARKSTASLSEGYLSAKVFQANGAVVFMIFLHQFHRNVAYGSHIRQTWLARCDVAASLLVSCSRVSTNTIELCQALAY